MIHLRLILRSLWFQMISKTMMIGVSLVVLATLSLALPQVSDPRTGSCSIKCKLYYKCNNNETLPASAGFGENIIDLR